MRTCIVKLKLHADNKINKISFDDFHFSALTLLAFFFAKYGQKELQACEQ